MGRREPRSLKSQLQAGPASKETAGGLINAPELHNCEDVQRACESAR